MSALTDERAAGLREYSWLSDPLLEEWIVRAILPYADSVLDVGCGDGSMLQRYSKNFNSARGIEPSERLCEVARNRIGRHMVVKASAERIPFDDGSFDMAVAKSSLHHFDDISLGLAEMLRVSRRALAIIEVVAPSPCVMRFLIEILSLKERQRDAATIFSAQSLKDEISHAAPSGDIRQLFFDQYIDVERWLEFGDVSEIAKDRIREAVRSAAPGVREAMQIHHRGGRVVMLRRMCLTLFVFDESGFQEAEYEDA